MVSLFTIRNSSTRRIFARLLLAESDAVTTLMDDPFLNSTIAAVLEIKIVPISFLSRGDIGISSILIFSSTLILCPRVPEAIQTLVPGYRIHRTQQNTARSHDLPCSLLPCRLFIPQLLQFISRKFSILLRPTTRPADTLGRIIALNRAQRLCVTVAHDDVLTSELASQRSPILPAYCPHITMRRGQTLTGISYIFLSEKDLHHRKAI